MKTLKTFYSNVRPWGWWKPVYQALKTNNPTITKNTDFVSDMLNCIVGILWQSSMILIPIFFIIRDYPKTWMALLLFLATSATLKFTWLDKVNKYKN